MLALAVGGDVRVEGAEVDVQGVALAGDETRVSALRFALLRYALLLSSF